MRAWASSPRWVILLSEVFALLVFEGRGQTYDVTYHSNSACNGAVTSSTLVSQTINPPTCLTINNAMRGDGEERGYKIVCASATSQAASYASVGSPIGTALLINVDPGGCGVSADGATSYYDMPLENICWKIQGSRDLWLKWNYPVAKVSLCGETLPVTPPVTPSVSGDPVTWHGNVREEFILPPGCLSPLIKSPDMHILASSRPGHEEDEWIDRVVVTSAAGEYVLDVSIKRNLTYFNRATLLPNSFETLDVNMEWWQRSQLVVMPPGDAQFNHWSGIHLAFGRVRHFGQLKAGPAPRREAVYVVSPSLKILILSSSAREYFLERGDLGMENSHLDLEIMEMGDQSTLTGILPELWGLQPMSEATRALRKLPKSDDIFEDGPRLALPKIVDASETPAPSPSSEEGNCTASLLDGDVPHRGCRLGSQKEGVRKAVPIGSVEGFSGERAYRSLTPADLDVGAAL